MLGLQYFSFEDLWTPWYFLLYGSACYCLFLLDRTMERKARAASSTCYNSAKVYVRYGDGAVLFRAGRTYGTAWPSDVHIPYVRYVGFVFDCSTLDFLVIPCVYVAGGFLMENMV